MDTVIAFMFYNYLGERYEHASYYARRIFYPERPERVVNNPVSILFPLYGIVAFAIIYVNKLLEKRQITNLLVKFIAFSLIAVILELIAGLALGAGPSSVKDGKVYLWDYSDEAYNYKGLIALRTAITWGILGLILIKIHPYVIEKIKCII